MLPRLFVNTFSISYVEFGTDELFRRDLKQGYLFEYQNSGIDVFCIDIEMYVNECHITVFPINNILPNFQLDLIRMSASKSSPMMEALNLVS